jgi:hypothetical protein
MGRGVLRGQHLGGDYGSGTVTKLRASDGANLGTFGVGAFPIGVAFEHLGHELC